MIDETAVTKIFIKDLLLACTIGVTKLEREEKQSVLINVTMWTDTELSGKTDDIAQTINYKDVYLEIIKLTEQGSFHLLERLAEEISKVCLKYAKVEKVEVRVEKPKALKRAKCSGVEITRVK